MANETAAVEYKSVEEAEKAIQDADLEIAKWRAFQASAHQQLDKLNINSKVDSTLGKMSPGEREIAIQRLTAQAEEDRRAADQAKKDKAAADAEQAKADEEARRAVAEAKKTA